MCLCRASDAARTGSVVDISLAPDCDVRGFESLRGRIIVSRLHGSRRTAAAPLEGTGDPS
eukprot:1997969-Prymnesium_polylepis.1